MQTNTTYSLILPHRTKLSSVLPAVRKRICMNFGPLCAVHSIIPKKAEFTKSLPFF